MKERGLYAVCFTALMAASALAQEGTGSTFAESPKTVVAAALVPVPVLSNTTTQPLAVEQAFRIHAVRSNQTFIVDVQIMKGHYLYKDRFSLSLGQRSLAIAQHLPQGDHIEDPYFGNVPILDRSFQLELPLPQTNSDPARALELEVYFQGCAKGRVCYPPTRRAILL